MANELTITGSLRFIKGSSKFERNPGTLQFDVSGSPFAAGAQSIGTATHEAIAMNDVATAGWYFFRNLDQTNYVEVGKDVGGTFHAFLKLEPNETSTGRLALNAPYAKANTGACVLEYGILSD